MEKIKPDDLVFERLNETNSDTIKKFSCWQKDLVDFLLEDALPNQKRGISVTYLFFLKNPRTLVGYMSVLTDAINLNADLKGYFRSKEKIEYKSLPALKIGRLAVDDNHFGKGIGTQMIYFATFLAREIHSKYCGCRFLTLDAKRGPTPEKDSPHFYRKLGFEVLKPRDKGSVPMYLDLWLEK